MRLIRLIGALLFAFGLSNMSAWYVWDKNHMPVSGFIMLLGGVLLYLITEFEEEF